MCRCVDGSRDRFKDALLFKSTGCAVVQCEGRNLVGIGAKSSKRWPSSSGDVSELWQGRQEVE